MWLPVKVLLLLATLHVTRAHLQLSVDCSLVRNCSKNDNHPGGAFCLKQNFPIPDNIVASACSREPLGECSATHARFLDTAVDPAGQWHSLKAALSFLNRLDAQQFPVVLLSISSLTCDQGCCVVSFFLRPGDTDAWVLQQMLSKEHGYQFLQELNWTPHTILDAGANAGYATVVLALLFPKATIIALEPDPDNYDLLKLNTRRFGNVVQLQKGLWDKDAALIAQRRECNHGRQPSGAPIGCSWGVRVVETSNPSEANVMGTSVPSLLRDFGLYSFDYLKIDVEGAERNIFATTPAWVHGIKVLSIEVHEWGEAHEATTMSLVAAALHHSSFVWTRIGEYHVYFKRDFYNSLVRDHKDRRRG